MTGNINSNDVLCGRGGATNNHIGNKRFRTIISEYQLGYLQARKKEKVVVARRIVDCVKMNGGRFLKRDDSTNMWVEVSIKKATEKTSQALREGLDVRHKTIRPEKMHRLGTSPGNDESPRKRARLVEGEVVDTKATGEDIPELNDDQSAGSSEPTFLQLAPPNQSEFDSFIAV
jgi:hypothetical protein